MERMFDTHRVRKSREALPIWTVTTLDPGGLNGPEKTILPGVWEAHPRLKSYRGRAVYEQEITCGGHVRLWLGGVSFRTRVWLDDALLCTHYGGYTGFEALAENVAPGVHTLRIEADNRFGPDSALHIPNDYYTYGGVNRPVVIEEVNDTYIAWVHVTPRKAADGWHALAEARLCNLAREPRARTLRLEIAGERAELSAALPAGEDVTVSADILCPNAETWTPDHRGTVCQEVFARLSKLNFWAVEVPPKTSRLQRSKSAFSSGFFAVSVCFTQTIKVVFPSRNS